MPSKTTTTTTVRAAIGACVLVVAVAAAAAPTPSAPPAAIIRYDHEPADDVDVACQSSKSALPPYLTPKTSIRATSCVVSGPFREEDALVNFFGAWRDDGRVGTYVELGALDGVKYSNTLALASCRNWTGVLIEASRSNFDKLTSNLPLRSGATAYWGGVCAAPGDSFEIVDGKEADATSKGEQETRRRYLRVKTDAKNESEVVRDDGDDAEDEKKKKKNATALDAPCQPMSAYLDEIDHIDFFSIDMSAADVSALDALDIHDVDVVLVEMMYFDFEHTQAIRDFFTDRDYQECADVVAYSGLFVRTAAIDALDLTSPCHPNSFSAERYMPNHAAMRRDVY